MFAQTFALLALAATSVFAGVIPKDVDNNYNPQGAPTGPPTTRPVVLTATKVMHTLVPTSPWLIDITTTVVWTQYPAHTPRDDAINQIVVAPEPTPA